MKRINGQLVEEIAEGSTVSTNLSQTIIKTTEDKITICLMKYIEHLEKRNEWQTPLGILLTIVLTFLTTDFKNFFYIDSNVWKGIFGLSGLISFYYVARFIYSRKKLITIMDIVKEIKGQKIE